MLYAHLLNQIGEIKSYKQKIHLHCLLCLPMQLPLPVHAVSSCGFELLSNVLLLYPEELPCVSHGVALLATNYPYFCLSKHVISPSLKKIYIYMRSVHNVSSHVIWKIETFIEEDTRYKKHCT